ncbi:hypothetical protein GW17_00023079 [Ensete ventricosum]|nr:hypothetical protein GW17_00023079 [Ensete ventricosum]RZS08480.1 hypothetical protein BHM03_00039458 [Ensete ventricosum]
MHLALCLRRSRSRVFSSWRVSNLLSVMTNFMSLLCRKESRVFPPRRALNLLYPNSLPYPPTDRTPKCSQKTTRSLLGANTNRSISESFRSDDDAMGGGTPKSSQKTTRSLLGANTNRLISESFRSNGRRKGRAREICEGTRKRANVSYMPSRSVEADKGPVLPPKTARVGMWVEKEVRKD